MTYQFLRLLHCRTGVMVRPWLPAPEGIRDTLNKSLTPSSFTRSFRRRQEPKTLWTEVPAFAGTTGRVQYPGHGLIQRFHRTVDLSAPRGLVQVGQSKPSLRRRPGRVARRMYCRMYCRYYQSISYRMDKGFGAAKISLLQNCFSRIALLFKGNWMDTGAATTASFCSKGDGWRTRLFSRYWRKPGWQRFYSPISFAQAVWSM